jgi:hypothetical protein
MQANSVHCFANLSASSSSSKLGFVGLIQPSIQKPKIAVDGLKTSKDVFVKCIQ